MKYTRFGFWMKPSEWLYHCPNILCIQLWWFHFHSWFSYNKFPYVFCRFMKVGNYPKKFKIYAVFFWKPTTLKEAVLKGYAQESGAPLFEGEPKP
jgi:hypothetical protein